jgi:hypothetical protein
MTTYHLGRRVNANHRFGFGKGAMQRSRRESSAAAEIDHSGLFVLDALREFTGEL